MKEVKVKVIDGKQYVYSEELKQWIYCPSGNDPECEKLRKEFQED